MIKKTKTTQYGPNTGIIPRPIAVEREMPSFRMIPRPVDPTRRKLGKMCDKCSK